MSKYLADVIEVAQRLKGKNAQPFHHKLQALLNPAGQLAGITPDGIITPEFYEKEFGITFGPRFTEAQAVKLKEFGFRILYIPAIGEDDYPESFIKPAWGRYLTVADIQRQPLSGRFVAIETIAKPNWDDPAGYPDDKLGRAIGSKTRFGVSWDDLHGDGGILAKIAKELGLPATQVRLPYAEEWNFAGNLFNHLRETHGEKLPDLGSTNSWEWCENSFGSDYRLIAGSRGIGGLADVYCSSRGNRDDLIAFRVLAVL